MELGVLGPLQVRQNGVPVSIPGAKPRAILTMLGLHGGSVVSADTLVELLWGDDPPRTAAKALQTHISLLRRTLGDGFVLTEGAGWALAGADIDALRYKSAARLGRDAVAAGDTSEAVARFEEALAFWRGAPELPDGRRGISEKTRWVEGHAALVEDRADALLATGRAAEIIGELEAAVADAPLRERRWGQLMLALYRAGRQGEALGAYQRARALLADELGVDPGPELRRLEAAIVAQDPSLDGPVAQQVSSVTRAVTFLLTDIEGSTAAWEADAAAMGVALARHDELVEQVVTSRGGRLIKTRGEGDATFSVFDRPSAGAAAAIELQEAIAQEPWALRDPMRVRVALHTGEVELRDGDYFGRAVNRAARLRSLANGGQILCSGATAELVIDSLSDDVVLVDLGTRQLRNLPRPEHVFELRLDRVEEAVVIDVPLERPGLPAVFSGPGPFVGRGDELERLSSAWQTVLAGGTNAILIAGEPGVGKTRLAGEWSRQAYDQGALVIYGRCDEDLGAPYQPFAEALRSLVPCVGAKTLRGLRGLEALLPLVPGLTDVLPDLAAPTPADPDTERYALFDAVVALLGLTSTSVPIVLVLDDLHWAAKPTLLLLRHLLRFGEHARVQVIGTYRSTDLDRSHPLAAMLADLHRDGTAHRLQLSGLAEEDVSAYVAEAGYNDDDLARALASVTGGNPFFLIEALRHVDESGGRWDQTTLPQGVREAVTRRLTRLAPETNKALAAAAVVGSRFGLELVERVVGDDLVDAFDEAAKAGIVIEEPGGRYRFNHALVRQSLLAELPSVRRMRLHQRIATTLENEPGADDELLAELAYHYFECAWAGNAAKAVEYCRRAADQAMVRLAYEGAAELYDRALHALEEIDEDLPDRGDQTAALLIARCEALLAAGDVASAAGAVSQLQSQTAGSARLAAWATSFDGQLSMLVHPERLDEILAAVSSAAATLAELDDPAGEAKAHTVRAGCLARLGRVGDCEVALDDALTAARCARDHRLVNAVLANAPLAALWGPNPVPRAGGRCLDVVRLLRITTDSPSVEATSTRCQAVLEAFRGRAAAARRMIDSARRTVSELGLRHALMEVEQFAGIVELVVDEPAAAEEHLRKAYNGFRRMGLDADTAETAALLGRACLVLDRVAEADELCSESERLAGHALKPSMGWRTLRALLLSRAGEHVEARRVAEAAVALAERTDALVDHAEACSALATVLGAAGDAAGARAAAERAANLYERKGAAALAERARNVIGKSNASRVTPKTPLAEPTNACAEAGGRLVDAVNRESWDEVTRLLAQHVTVENRRKIVGFPPIDVPSSQWPEDMRRYLETGLVRYRAIPLAACGERHALFRLEIGTTDSSSGAPQDEELQLVGLDEDGRIALQVKFDIEDVDAALAELEATFARFERHRNRLTQAPETPTAELDNACVRAGERLLAAIARRAWDEVPHFYSPEAFIESRRKIVGFAQMSADHWVRANRHLVESGDVRMTQGVIAVRGERLALSRLRVDSPDVTPGAPYDEFLVLYGIDDELRFTLQVWFDIDDIDAALAELDAQYSRFEEGLPPERRLGNAASHVDKRLWQYFAAGDWDAVGEVFADDFLLDDRRQVVSAGLRRGRDIEIENLRAMANLAERVNITSTVIATRGERLALRRLRFSDQHDQSDAFYNEMIGVVEVDANQRILTHVVFSADDFEAAVAELDARYPAGEAAAHARTWAVVSGAYTAINRQELFATTSDWTNLDHRPAAAFAIGDAHAYIRASLDDGAGIVYVEAVHRLSDLGAVVTWAAKGTTHEGFDAEWRGIHLLTADGDLISRFEVFDEADLDAAIARFDQLARPAGRLGNAASRVAERFGAEIAAKDWPAIAETLAGDVSFEDRRRVVNAGIRHGRDAEIEDLQTVAEVGFTTGTSVLIATRGERLALARSRYSVADERHDAFQNEVLNVIEIDDSERIAAVVILDPNDFEAAIAELDARYIAGEAAAHARTWKAITGAYAAHNRREVAPTTSNVISVDHRRVARFAPGEGIEYIRAGWEIDQELKIYATTVHRLNDRGALLSWAGRGASHQGFAAEWRGLNLFTVDDELISRAEVFDEADLDTALAQFDELSRSVPRLENAASQATERFLGYFAAREWDAMADALADDLQSDDRRRVVNAGDHRGRDAELENFRLGAALGTTHAEMSTIATRGERLALAHAIYFRGDEQPDAFSVHVLQISEIDADDRISAFIAFDPDDFDAAIAELDARYLAGEAATFASTWSAIARAYASISERKPPATTPDWINIDHRRAAAFAPGDANAYVRAIWDLTPDVNIYVESVLMLGETGAVISHASHGTSRGGFDAEWRAVNLFTVEGDTINRCEIFDEADIDAATARFAQLSQPVRQLENTAARVFGHVWSYYAARNWDAMAQTVADDYLGIDRRLAVNAEIQRSRDEVIRDLQAAAGVGFSITMVSAIAIRGERLVLARVRASGSDPEAIQNDALIVVEIDTADRIATVVTFDLEDFDAAIAELDTRYLAGEATAHSRRWVAVLEAYAAINRHELPPTTPDFVNEDHRRGAAFAAGDMIEYLRAGWDLDQDICFYVEAVHRLDDLGTVVSHMGRGTSGEGFDAEWREVILLTISGDAFNRCEVFDVTDVDAATNRFEELHPLTRQLKNGASRADDRVNALFAERRWDEIDALLAKDVQIDDRRRGLRRDSDGRAAEVANARVIADIGVRTITSHVLGVRGARLALTRTVFSGRDQRPDAFHTELLRIAEIDTDDRIVAYLAFDPDDFDGATAELDARYLAGEAAAYSHTWSVIKDNYAALNRHESSLTTSDWVLFDHRRGTLFGTANSNQVSNIWDTTPDLSIKVEVVHRLSDLGAVVTHVAHGTSPEGFDAEWREVAVSTVRGDKVDRCELFDETDLDVALARFDELARPALRQENSASQAGKGFVTHFAAGNWDAMAEMLADNFTNEDRRRTVGVGVRHGRDAQIADMRQIADLFSTEVTTTTIATRGTLLALIHLHFAGRDRGPEEFLLETVCVLEIDDEQRLAAAVFFDPDEIGAAIGELDARYLAGEAAAHAHTWSVVMEGHAVLNRHEVPPMTPDCVSIDHRRGPAFTPGEVIAYFRSGWEDGEFLTYVECVHSLTARGAVGTYVGSGISHEGFDAEWRGVELVTVDGNAIDRLEIFDESDLEAAIATLDQLSRRPPRRENAASRADFRFNNLFASKSWDALGALLAEDIRVDDRRRGLRRESNDRATELRELQAIAELGVKTMTSRVLAIRGERLALVSTLYEGRDQRPEAFRTEVLRVAEIDTDERIVAYVAFDPDNLDAAIAELEDRYRAGEAAGHAHTWSLVTDAFAAINRHELPKLAPDWVNIDHRRGAAHATGEMTSYLHALFHDVPDISVVIEIVHRLSDLGAVVTQAARGTSQDGFEAEWREVGILQFDCDLISRFELFEEADLDTALARFEELALAPARLENSATRLEQRLFAHWAAREWDSMAELLTDDSYVDDRRRTVNAGFWRGRDVVVTNLRALAEGGANLTRAVIATRGERLALFRLCSLSADPKGGGFGVEMLDVVEIDPASQISAHVLFDIDDIDAAFAELESRYLAGEAAEHAHAWSIVSSAYAAMNRHELFSTTPNWINIDHRRPGIIEEGGLNASLRSLWDLIPDITFRVEAVHRLSERGAVCSHVAQGVSRDGFNAEWRGIEVMTVDGDQIDRCEIFDEADLDAALAHFQGLDQQAQRPNNAAGRVHERLQALMLSRDWDSIAESLADGVIHDDRRRMVNAVIQEGRGAVTAEMAALFDVGVRNHTSEVIATRGEYLVLSRSRTWGRGDSADAFQIGVLDIVEIDAEERLLRRITFDPEDMDAAFAELESRYIAGEAATHAHMWALVTSAYEALNRRQLPATSADWVNIDHRRLTPIPTGDLDAYLLATWALSPRSGIRIEAVHRLSNLGAVVTQVVEGTSHQGFDAEWRTIDLSMYEGDKLIRTELFDEADLNAALARFDELNRPAAVANLATQARTRLADAFNRRDLKGFLELTNPGGAYEDRRRGFHDEGPIDAKIARALFEVAPEAWRTEVETVAVRGDRLALTRDRYRDSEADKTVVAEHLTLTRVGEDGLVHDTVLFDPDDITGAMAELTDRWVASGEVLHPNVIRAIHRLQESSNRHDWDTIAARIAGAAYVNHRQLSNPAADTIQDFLSGIRMWASLIPDFRVELAEVITHSRAGLVAQTSLRGTSTEGSAVEIPLIELVLFDGDRVTRFEAFDYAQRALALARFEELNRSV
ncbi:BTAD domain-containing putative transcriptional regulator [Mycobacterium sp. Marseille-P9652]|uniref:BTAD domain-containing putative transcriptional regulator n=1 Tax=Mycobacterium sp. Marseille-P9652 TaxID=2654950 RepID=UPI0012E90C78|nr:BTAD domain-containing putative transcriptional regulator [Mycobacterium sp. Marseille-P9652]